VSDDSWQRKGGHISLNGVVTDTNADTAVVIDVAILTKHCTCPDKLKRGHTVVRRNTVEQEVAWRLLV